MGRVINHLIRKALLALPTLLLLSLLIFSTMWLIPLSARVRLYKQQESYQHPSHLVSDETIIAKYRLNEPFLIQWAGWLTRTLHGNLGFSWVAHSPVAKTIMTSFKTTVEIVLYAAPLTVFVGYKLGVLAAKKAHKRTFLGGVIDKVIRVTSTVGYSTPAFIFGLSFLLIFYIGFHWPSIGRLGTEPQLFIRSSEFIHYIGLHTVDALLNGKFWILLDALQHLTLPVLTITLNVSPIMTRITRASMIGEFTKPYTIVARGKGLKEKEVLDHMKRLAAFPVFTVSGILVASMLTGVVVVEYFFNIKGVGYWLVKAATKWDYPLLVALALLFCTVFIIANIFIDVAYTYLDPRVEL
ncbi:MAG: ABC transporter permease [Thermoproteota archaeon]